MENHHCLWENPLSMVIFNSYVKLPEGKSRIDYIWLVLWNLWNMNFMIFPVGMMIQSDELHHFLGGLVYRVGGNNILWTGIKANQADLSLKYIWRLYITSSIFFQISFQPWQGSWRGSTHKSISEGFWNFYVWIDGHILIGPMILEILVSRQLI